MSQMHGTVMDQAPKAAVRLPMTPGRRVALWIGVPLCVLCVAFTAFNLVADVGRGTISVSYQLPAGASRVSVTSSGGNVVLRQAAAGPGTVTGTGYYSLVRPHVTHSHAGGTAYFDYHCVLNIGSCGLNTTVLVPRGKAVSVSTDGGDVTAVGTVGDITLSTGGGNVTVSQLGGDVSVDTRGGDIQASDITAVQVTADTGGGDIQITFTRVPTDVQVSTAGGDITIIVPPGGTHYKVKATTNGGDVQDSILQNSSSQNQITASSGGGNITLRTAS